MPHPLRWFRSITLLSLLSLLAIAASAATEDPAGGPADVHDSHIATPAAPAGLGDMMQPVPRAAAAIVAPAVRTDLDELPPPAWAQVPLAERLATLSAAQRANAVLELELPSAAPPIDRLTATRIAALWNDARHEEAIAALRAFEGAGGRAAVGIAWKQPVSARETFAATAGGGDVRIGARTGGRLTSLDFDATSGALYAVVGWGPATAGEAYWTVNRSVDHGATWTETYAWYAGATGGLLDLSAVVVGGYIYVGYVPGDVQTEYRLRRCLASTGATDGTYGFVTLFDAGALTLRQVTLTSNALTSNNRLYCFAILSDDTVRFWWTVASTATSFTENSPVGATARTGLDATWNPGYAAYYVHLAYAGTDDLIHVQRLGTAGWTDRTLLSAVNVTHRHGVAISAYDDAVICAYEYGMNHGTGITYGISYDAGVTAFDMYNYVYQPDGVTTFTYQCPDVDAQDGHGTAIIASCEVGEPDKVFYRKRAGYAPGLWEDASQFNDLDVLTGSQNTLAHVPVIDETRFHHGAIYFNGSIPYFDRPMLETAGVPGGPSAMALWLSPPAPSPMRDRATVRFTLPAPGAARLELFDVRGAKVATLAEGWLDAGTHTRTIDGAALGSGVYFCRLRTDVGEAHQRFAVIH